MATITSDVTPTLALTPPPGTTSNFDHPATSKGPMTIAIGVVIPMSGFGLGDSGSVKTVRAF